MIIWVGFSGLAAGLVWFFWLKRRQMDVAGLPHLDEFQKQMEQAAKFRISSKHLSNRGKKLEYAGQTSAHAAKHLVKEISTAGVAGAFAVFLVGLGLPSVLIPAFVIVGLFWPSMKLNQTIRKRRAEITLSLPYYLDLLTLAMEAGLDLIAALDELVETDRPSPLRDEVALTLKSIQMGRGRSEAFQMLAQRTGVVPLAQLASAITQSEELGSSLGQLLRLQSDALRRQLFREAEEKAQKAPLRMLMPLLLFIFPVAFLLLFVPLIMKLIVI